MWYKINGDQAEIKIYAKPNAKKTALIAINEQGLNISLHAKPLEDEANKELILFLAEYFNIPKSRISLLRGNTSKHKWVSMPLNDKVRQLLQM